MEQSRASSRLHASSACAHVPARPTSRWSWWTTGRIEARVWKDVELLDARFAEGDAIRLLGRVERFRDKLQLGIRSLEAAPEADPAEISPALRRDPEELDGFLEFLAGKLHRPGIAATVQRFAGDTEIRAAGSDRSAARISVSPANPCTVAAIPGW